MLTMRWRYLFTIAATTLAIAFCSPALAAFKLPVNNLGYSTNAVIIADNSVLTTKQNQSSNLFQQLNLTNKQREQIKQIHHKYKQQIRKKNHTLSILQKQLSDLMVGTESVELIRAKNQQLVNLRQEIGQLRFEIMLATREILTPQQRQKFREIIESEVAEQTMEQ